jgi:hypothetical protein
VLNLAAAGGRGAGGPDPGGLPADDRGRVVVHAPAQAAVLGKHELHLNMTYNDKLNPFICVFESIKSIRQNAFLFGLYF